MQRAYSGFLCVVLVLSMLMAVAWAQDEVLYTGVTIQDASVRETKSQSGKRLARLKSGETVHILSLGDQWFRVRAGDVEGYVVAGLITDLQALTADNPLPEAYTWVTAQSFRPLYRAKVTKKLSLRKTPETGGKLLATLYAGDEVQLGEVGTEWTPARKGKNVGYVLTEFVTELEVLDPYQPLLPGQKLYPYAARVLDTADVFGTVHGQTGALQTLPQGAVIAVGEPDQNGDLLMPFLRTVGQLNGDLVELEPVATMSAAQPGDMISVFSTFYTPGQDSELMTGRRFNIEKGVGILDGQVVQAGARFSFNALAGPYTADNGYKKGPIINYVSDKKTGFGGGICQLTTTLYNALLQIQVQFVRCEPHSSYGIEYAPVDYDAAVGNANQDFIFDNVMPYDIRMEADTWEGVVTVRIYRDGEPTHEKTLSDVAG